MDRKQVERVSIAKKKRKTFMDPGSSSDDDWMPAALGRQRTKKRCSDRAFRPRRIKNVSKNY